MAVILVLSISILMQFCAALYALVLMRHFGGRLVWLALATALFMMTVRRSLSFFKAVENYPNLHQSLETELVALLISGLVLVAIIALRPMIESISRSEKKLVEETQRNNIILESSPDGVCITNTDGIIEEVNPAYCQMLAMEEGALLGRDFSSLASPLSTVNSKDILEDIVTNDHGRYDLIQSSSANRSVHMELIGRHVVSGDHDFIYLFLRDITERHVAQKKLKEQKEKALVTLASIGDGVITTDVTGAVDFMNEAAENLCGLGIKKAKRKKLMEVCRLVDEDSHTVIENPVTKAIEKNGPVYLSHNLILQNQENSSVYSVEVVVSPIFDNKNRIMGTVLVLHDITELRGMAQQLSYQAKHDSLTGLINRREFEERLKDVLHKVKKDKTEDVLFYMDLDQFKIINDTCGHLAGDEMLLEISQLIQSCMRESDTLGRLGGDEFGVLLENCHIDKAIQVANKIHDELSSFRFSWDDNVFEVGVSIGIVPINDSVINISDLLSAADSACYVAKEKGRNTEHIYVTGDKALAQHHGQMKWYQRIQRALDEGRFILYMQKIQPVDKDLPSHFEILLRMIGEDNEIISPLQFLPTAERYHMAIDIDRWVLRTVFSEMKKASSRIASLEGSCAINISGQSLGREDFLEYVIALFDEFKIDGRRLCFEITETAVISNISHARKFMAEMKSRGCEFSLDDFGSGLSSFSYLKNLDVNYLKIDGGFVRNILNDERDYNMVSTINHLGHSLGLKTIAEFVEDQQVQEALQEMGVDYLQGYEIDIPSAAGNEV